MVLRTVALSADIESLAGGPGGQVCLREPQGAGQLQTAE